MEQSILVILNYITNNGYVALFSAMIIIGIGIPIPSELALGFAGYLVFSGVLSFLPAVSVAVIGELLGAAVGYGLGFYSGTALVRKYFKYLLPSNEKLLRVEHWITKYGMLVVLIGRILPVIRGAIPIPAGFFRMDFKTYLLSVILSSLIWCAMLIFLGFTLGQNWHQLYSMGHSAGLGVLVLIAVGIMFSVIRQKKRKV